MNRHKNIFIIGPGGVGKTTAGKILAKKLGYKFIDLDDEFCKMAGSPGHIVDTHGYEKYCEKNSHLFDELLIRNLYDTVFALSSGFLVHENQNALIKKHRKALKDNGISVLLMPSESIEESENIIIQRQLKRGFGLNEKREKEKFKDRFPKYLLLGDIKIFSNDGPESIAEEMKKELSGYEKVLCLSIKQPWLNLILDGKKDIEIRTWKRNLQLPITICLHAGLKSDKMACEMFNMKISKNDLGAILGTATLTGFKEYKSLNEFESDQKRHHNLPEWYDGKQIGFILTNAVRTKKSVPWKGQLGLFKVPIDILE